MKSSIARVMLMIGATAAFVTAPVFAQDASLPDARSPLRHSPLPYIQPWRSMLENNGTLLSAALPEQDVQRLTPATAASVSRLLQRLPPAMPSRHDPVILLSESAATDATGDPDGLLRAVVQGPFMRAEWNEARSELRDLLSRPLPRSLEARARFYLGQSLYFSGLYRDATLEFLLAQHSYYAESTPWIHAALAALARES